MASSHDCQKCQFSNIDISMNIDRTGMKFDVDLSYII